MSDDITKPGWLEETFRQAKRRRFTDALEQAKAELEAVPEWRRADLSRRFDEAIAAAKFHAEYMREMS